MAKNQVACNIESEKAVIGSMIASRKACYDALNLLNKDDFYSPANQIVFEAIQNVERQNKPIDNVAITNELKTNMKKLDQIGGVDYLYELSDYYMGDKNASYHISTIFNLSLIRKLFNCTSKLNKEFFEKEITDVDDFIEKYDNAIYNLIKNRASGDFKDTSDILSTLSKTLQEKRKETKKSYLVGVDTGYKELNKYTAGWQPGQLIILAARPSVGKTAFAINLIYNAAYKSHKTVALFSLEMSAEDIVNRLLASISYVGLGNLKTGDLTDNDWLAVQQAEDDINNVKILIDDTSGIKLGEIKTKITKLKAKDPNLGLVVIDYLGLINLNNPRLDIRESVTEISRQLKSFARDIGVPIVCLCQLSRANEKASRRPVLSDLRDSGSIEQDADIVMFLYRENYQKPGQQSEDNSNDSTKEDMDITEVIVQKNRNGKTGTIKLAFMKNIGKFVELADEGN